MPSLRNEVVTSGAWGSSCYLFKDKGGLWCWSEEREGKGDWQGLVWGGVGGRGEGGQERGVHASNLLKQHRTHTRAQTDSEDPHLTCLFRNLPLHKNYRCHDSEKPISPTFIGS